MKPEIEVRFLNVNHDEVRAKLRAAGGECTHPLRLMRRQMLDYPDGRLRAAKPACMLRLRDEGDRVTVTYKQARPGSDYADETETTVGSFDIMSQLLQTIGLEYYSVTEQKRETWQLHDVEIMLDEWPWVQPFIEVEGPSEEAVRAVAAELGFDWANRVSGGGIDTVYRAEYHGMTEDDTVYSLPEVRFGTPVPEWLEAKRQPTGR